MFRSCCSLFDFQQDIHENSSGIHNAMIATSWKIYVDLIISLLIKTICSVRSSCTHHYIDKLFSSLDRGRWDVRRKRSMALSIVFDLIDSARETIVSIISPFGENYCLVRMLRHYLGTGPTQRVLTGILTRERKRVQCLCPSDGDDHFSFVEHQRSMWASGQRKYRVRYTKRNPAIKMVIATYLSWECSSMTMMHVLD